MAKKPRKTSWSYSAWAKYDKCPKLYDAVYNKGVREKESPASARGENIHNKAEQLLLGNIRGMPNELKHFDHEFKQLKKASAKPELELALDKNWKPVEFHDPKVWVRGKLDAGVALGTITPAVVDFKTGKKYDSHEDQAEIYALMCFFNFPETQYLQVEFWYLDLDDSTIFNYTHKDVPWFQKKWKDNATRMLNGKSYPPKPGKHCDWCHIRSDKGGTCEAWKDL
jgi:hypothetical protein